MPRHKQPEPLEDICVKLITASLQQWRLQNKFFQTLPANLIEKIIDEVLNGPGSDKHKRRLFLESGSLLMGVRAKNVKFRYWRKLCSQHKPQSTTELDTWFYEFITQCKYLTELDMVSWKRTPKNASLFSLLNRCDLSRLQVLNLSDLGIVDSTIELLGHSCPELQELRLFGCANVTDEMLEKLVRNQDGQCVLKKLKSLDVRGTKVGPAGFQCVLESVPSLTHLYDFCDYVIPVAHKVVADNPDMTHFNLEHVFVDDFSHLYQNLDKIAHMPLNLTLFPRATDAEVRLLYPWDHQELESLSPLQNLSKLCISGLGPIPRPFHPHFQSTLRNIGKSVCELQLDGVADFSFRTLGQCCPNLRNFNIQFWSISEEGPPYTFENSFQFTQKVCLLNIGERCNNNSLFTSLFRSMPQLQNLFLENIEVGDNLLTDVHDNNPLIHLEELAIGGACAMSEEAILRCAESCPMLTKFTYGRRKLNAAAIPRRDKVAELRRLRNHAKSRMWALEFVMQDLQSPSLVFP